LPSCRYRPARRCSRPKPVLPCRPPPTEVRGVHPRVPAPAIGLPRPEGRAGRQPGETGA
jgi:hypothetical protein